MIERELKFLLPRGTSEEEPVHSRRPEFIAQHYFPARHAYDVIRLLVESQSLPVGYSKLFDSARLRHVHGVDGESFVLTAKSRKFLEAGFPVRHEIEKAIDPDVGRLVLALATAGSLVKSRAAIHGRVDVGSPGPLHLELSLDRVYRAGMPVRSAEKTLQHLSEGRDIGSPLLVLADVEVPDVRAARAVRGGSHSWGLLNGAVLLSDLDRSLAKPFAMKRLAKSGFRGSAERLARELFSATAG